MQSKMHVKNCQLTVTNLLTQTLNAHANRNFYCLKLIETAGRDLASEKQALTRAICQLDLDMRARRSSRQKEVPPLSHWDTMRV